MPITPFAAVPNRNMSAAEFDAASDSFFGQLPSFSSELNEIETTVLGAQTLLDQATAAANAAIGTVNAEEWGTGTAYTTGDVVWSSVDFLTYRRKTDGSGSIDPSEDAANWAVITNTVFNDAEVSRVMLRDTGYVFVDKGDSGIAVQTIDFSAGTHQRIRSTGSFTLAFANWPPAGNFGEVLLELVGDGTGRVITFPVGTRFLKFDGSTTTTFSEAFITLQSEDGAIDWIYFWTRDAGATLYCKVVR
jgi:hypothetical protein